MATPIYGDEMCVYISENKDELWHHSPCAMETTVEVIFWPEPSSINGEGLGRRENTWGFGYTNGH